MEGQLSVYERKVFFVFFFYSLTCENWLPRASPSPALVGHKPWVSAEVCYGWRNIPVGETLEGPPVVARVTLFAVPRRVFKRRMRKVCFYVSDLLGPWVRRRQAARSAVLCKRAGPNEKSRVSQSPCFMSSYKLECSCSAGTGVLPAFFFPHPMAR